MTAQALMKARRDRAKRLSTQTPVEVRRALPKTTLYSHTSLTVPQTNPLTGQWTLPPRNFGSNPQC